MERACTTSERYEHVPIKSATSEASRQELAGASMFSRIFYSPLCSQKERRNRKPSGLSRYVRTKTCSRGALDLFCKSSVDTYSSMGVDVFVCSIHMLFSPSAFGSERSE